jgi:hypothetical protein
MIEFACSVPGCLVTARDTRPPFCPLHGILMIRVGEEPSSADGPKD